MVETMIWDPTDNLIKIHAEYFGDEFYAPSSTQVCVTENSVSKLVERGWGTPIN